MFIIIISISLTLPLTMNYSFFPLYAMHLFECTYYTSPPKSLYRTIVIMQRNLSLMMVSSFMNKQVIGVAYISGTHPLESAGRIAFCCYTFIPWHRGRPSHYTTHHLIATT
jgi:hypothetical protein